MRKRKIELRKCSRKKKCVERIFRRGKKGMRNQV